MSISHEELFGELKKDPEILAASEEYRLRMDIARILDKQRIDRGVSLRTLAREMDTSLSQVQRLFQEEHGGSLTLRTIVRAAQALDLRLSIYESLSQNSTICCRVDSTSWGPFESFRCERGRTRETEWNDESTPTAWTNIYEKVEPIGAAEVFGS